MKTFREFLETPVQEVFSNFETGIWGALLCLTTLVVAYWLPFVATVAVTAYITARIIKDKS